MKQDNLQNTPLPGSELIEIETGDTIGRVNYCDGYICHFTDYRHPENDNANAFLWGYIDGDLNSIFSWSSKNEGLSRSDPEHSDWIALSKKENEVIEK